jgi:predicted phosphodiesterase
MERIVVLPDIQFPYELTGLVQAAINFVGDYKPDKLVQIGDLMDYPQPSTWSKGTAEEFRGAVLQDNYYAKKVFLRPLRKVYDGPFMVFEGNHDLRPRQYLNKYAPALSGFNVFNFENMLDFDGFGIEKAPDFWDFAPGWTMTHGHLGGIRLSQTAGGSAIGAAKKFLKSVVMGHTHRMAVLPVTLGYGETETTLFGVEVGHMMDPRKAQYLKGSAANWQAGFVILNVDRENGLVIPEPIFVHGDTFKVDGEVYKIKDGYEFQ